MKIKYYKCKCGHNDFFFADKGNQKGIYCSYCGKWLKWADKDEQNLALKQESVLDKIIAEIEEIETYDGLYIDRAYVLEIIDKYKAESEIRAYDGYTDAFVSDDGKAYRYSDGKMVEVQDEI